MADVTGVLPTRNRSNKPSRPGQSCPNTTGRLPEPRTARDRVVEVLVPRGHDTMRAAQVSSAKTEKSWKKRPSARLRVTGEAGVGFPQLHLDHGEPLAGGEVVDEAGEVLRRGVDVQHVDRLAL